MTNENYLLVRVYPLEGARISEKLRIRLRILLEERLRILRQWDYHYTLFVTMCLDVLGEVAAAQGDPAWAARLWGAAQSQRTDGIPPLPLVFRSHHELHQLGAILTMG